MTARPSETRTKVSREQRDPGDEGSRQALVEKTADKWVRDSWYRLDPMTRGALSDAGYRDNGRSHDDESEASDWAFDVRRLIGLSLLASRAQGDLLDEQWEGWPLLLDNDAVMLADGYSGAT